MKCSVRKPRQELARHVACVWSLEHKHSIGQSCVERMVPTGYVELELYFGGEARVKEDQKNFSSKSSGILCGHKKRFTDFEFAGDLGVVSVVVRPEATRAIVGLPARLVKGSNLNLEDVWGASFLVEAIAEASDPETRFRLVEDFLIERLGRYPGEPEPVVSEAVSRISRCGGISRIEALAGGLGLGRRQLERKFSDQVGVSPKEFTRSIRFQKVLAIKQANPKISLTELAYSSGYSDQAHFVNDFKKITGYSPGAYFKKEDPFSEFYAYCA